MKLQSIILSLIISLTFVIYAQAQKFCTVFYEGTYRHQTGGATGCYGVDETDPIYKVYSDNPKACYTFYSAYNCVRGTEVFSGCGPINPPGFSVKSVYLDCSPPQPQ
ncbi:4687_t:CDS:2 [Ambispora leptoticha]|uniref:4687_t:CDS:1 n=1 Tax=Ambispora leptoticha TaxID=144679 RepID=A0A9N9ACY5_9GLOM|nr:4687_t:CDS:2 [Ambispora leptoticha]